MSQCGSTDNSGERERRCPKCGAAFFCGMAEGHTSECWCAAVPLRLPIPVPGSACYCARCLAELSRDFGAQITD